MVAKEYKMEDLKTEYLKLAKNKTQIELIDHLFDCNGFMLVKHKMKIDKAMDLVNEYPGKFKYQVYSSYPLIIDFRLNSVNFN